MKSLIIFGLLVFIFIISISSINVQSSKLEDSFVVVEDIEKARADIENQGGIVIHIFSDKNILIGSFPKKIKSRYIVEKYNEKSYVPFEIESEFISWKRMLDYKKIPLEEKLRNIPDKEINFGYNDLIIEEINPKDLEILNSLSQNAPFGASPMDTSSYFIGDVSVSIIFLESNEVVCTNPPTCTTFGPGSENWTNTEIQNVKDEIINGLNWWSLREPNAHLTFNINYEEKIPTDWEPIKYGSFFRDFWINDVMVSLGYGPEILPSTPLVYNYTNDQRENKSTDWGFTIFIVDSSNDLDGKFSDGIFAFTIATNSGGGPYTVMTYDNSGHGIANMDSVTAHETGHIFGALDQIGPFNCNDLSGYLNYENQNYGNGECLINEISIMKGTTVPFATGLVDQYARGQVGWQDTDSDGILDIEDVEPGINLTPHLPNPDENNTPNFDGASWINIFLSPNPFYNDISINNINNVEYRIDGGSWIGAAPMDGMFNNYQEFYQFVTSPLSWGNYLFETRAMNDIGIYTGSSNYGQDSLAIVGCTDSDNGINLSILGTVNNFDGTTFNSNQDYCINDRKIREYSCNGINIVHQDSFCSYGCGDGICLDKVSSPKKRFKEEP